MTTTMTLPSGSAPPEENAYRLLGTGANLLPREITEARRVRKARGMVLIALVGVVVVVAASYAFASFRSHAEQTKVDAAESQALQLRQQQSAYGDLVGTQKQVKAIRGQVATLLSYDIEWATLVNALIKAAPTGLTLGSLTTTLTDPSLSQSSAGSGPATATGLPSAAGVTVIGNIALTGRANNKTSVANYVDAVGRITGIGDVMLSNVTSETKQVTYALKADLTGAALSHHYAVTND